MSFFIVLFMMVAPVVVLFAKGYRFNLENGIFIYSGSVTIKSWPRDIEIYLDGERQTNKHYNVLNDAYTINGIKPGTYSLACKKEGYTAWRKQIDVHSGVSTEFWNVLLFPKENIRESNTFQASNIEQFFLSPRNPEEIVYFATGKEEKIETNKEQSAEEDSGQGAAQTNQIYLLDTEEEENSLLYSTQKYSFLEERENIEWNASNESVLFPLKNDKGEKTYLLAELKKDEIEKTFVLNNIFNQQPEAEKTEKPESAPDAGEEIEVETEGNEKIKKVRWMFNKKDELIILTQNHNLYHFDYKNPEDKTLISENVSGFDFAGNEIYYTQLPNNIVWQVSQNDLENKTQITNSRFLPENYKDKFISLTVYDEYRLFIKTETGKGLLFNKNPEKNETQRLETSSKITDVQFSDDGKKLLLWNSHEVWYRMLRDWKIQPKRESGEKIILTRFSSPVKNVQWMENYENIIFTVDKTIKSSEADPRDHLNMVDISKAETEFQEKDVIYNKNNQKLYYLGENALTSELLISKIGFLGF
ncbi:MAG: PEGA domain-containing protein [Candidatus Moranbacteria bacterium]|nr:PEGA domain-containing protein [Candidatus Moranbacteria bacterium]